MCEWTEKWMKNRSIFRLKKEYGQRQTGTIDQHITLKANRNKQTYKHKFLMNRETDQEHSYYSVLFAKLWQKHLPCQDPG